VSFIDQYDPKSPWADTRLRLAANHAVNWPAINEAENLGLATLTGGMIRRKFAYALPSEPYGYNPKKARQLLTDAGYANGFDAGECSTDAPYATVIEAVVNDLAAVGIRARVRAMGRAAMQTAQNLFALTGGGVQGAKAKVAVGQQRREEVMPWTSPPAPSWRFVPCAARIPHGHHP
jgi:ABC-type transport system substrate-binding protein